jgi:hypothetical protein
MSILYSKNTANTIPGTNDISGLFLTRLGYNSRNIWKHYDTGIELSMGE